MYSAVNADRKANGKKKSMDLKAWGAVCSLDLLVFLHAFVLLLRKHAFARCAPVHVHLAPRGQDRTRGRRTSSQLLDWRQRPCRPGCSSLTCSLARRALLLGPVIAGELLDMYGFFQDGDTKPNQIRDTKLLYKNPDRAWGAHTSADVHARARPRQRPLACKRSCAHNSHMQQAACMHALRPTAPHTHGPVLCGHRHLEGTFWMAYTIVKNKKIFKMKATGMPLVIAKYRSAITAADGGHAFGLLNMTIKDTIDKAKAAGAPEQAIDNAFMKAVIDTATGAAKRIIRSVISITNEATMRWVGATCGVDDLDTNVGRMSLSVKGDCRCCAPTPMRATLSVVCANTPASNTASHISASSSA